MKRARDHGGGVAAAAAAVPQPALLELPAVHANDIPQYAFRRIQIADVDTPKLHTLTPATMHVGDGVVWFAFDSCLPIGDARLMNTCKPVYGDVVATYRLKRAPRLLNVGHQAVRDVIAQRAIAAGHDAADVRAALDPDEQYSGGRANLRTSKLIRDVAQRLGFDGTYIRETGDARADDDLQGPDEMVLWQRFDELLHKF